MGVIGPVVNLTKTRVTWGERPLNQDIASITLACRELCWLLEDLALVSSITPGAIYKWNLNLGATQSTLSLRGLNFGSCLQIPAWVPVPTSANDALLCGNVNWNKYFPPQAASGQCFVTSHRTRTGRTGSLWGLLTGCYKLFLWL